LADTNILSWLAAWNEFVGIR